MLIVILVLYSSSQEVFVESREDSGQPQPQPPEPGKWHITQDSYEMTAG